MTSQLTSQDIEITFSSEDRRCTNFIQHQHFNYHLERNIQLNPSLQWEIGIKHMLFDASAIREKEIKIFMPNVFWNKETLDYISLSKDGLTSYAPKWTRMTVLNKHYFSNFEIEITNLKGKALETIRTCRHPTIITIMIKRQTEHAATHFHFSSTQDKRIFPNNVPQEFFVQLTKPLYIKPNETLKLSLIQINLPSQPYVQEDYSIGVYQLESDSIVDRRRSNPEFLGSIKLDLMSIKTNEELIETINDLIDDINFDEEGSSCFFYLHTDGKIVPTLSLLEVVLSEPLSKILGFGINRVLHPSMWVVLEPVNIQLSKAQCLMLHCNIVSDSVGGQTLSFIGPFAEKSLYYESTHPMFVPINDNIISNIQFKLTSVEGKSVTFLNDQEQVLLSVQMCRFAK